MRIAKNNLVIEIWNNFRSFKMPLSLDDLYHMWCFSHCFLLLRILGSDCIWLRSSIPKVTVRVYLHLYIMQILCCRPQNYFPCSHGTFYLTDDSWYILLKRWLMVFFIKQMTHGTFYKTDDSWYILLNRWFMVYFFKQTTHSTFY